MSAVVRQLNGASAVAPARSAREDGRDSGPPPHSKHGGTMRESDAFSELIAKKVKKSNSEFLTQLVIIDTLRFTVHQESLGIQYEETAAGMRLLELKVNKILSEIFGFSLGKKHKNGRDFYSHSWAIEEGFGHFAIGGGGQRGTMLFAISGTGCLAAKEGWERRLYLYFNSPSCINPVITRVDIAYDDLDGDFLPVRNCVDVYNNGGFDRRGNRPSVEQRGSWINDDKSGAGLSFYVGTKHASQCLRVYEKGKQLGDKASKWVRIEVQFSNVRKVIPLDIIIDGLSYFVAAYPILSGVSDREGKRLDKKNKVASANVESYIRNIKNSYGKFLKFGRFVFGDEVLLNMIESQSTNLPKKISWLNYFSMDVVKYYLLSKLLKVR